MISLTFISDDKSVQEIIRNLSEGIVIKNVSENDKIKRKISCASTYGVRLSHFLQGCEGRSVEVNSCLRNDRGAAWCLTVVGDKKGGKRNIICDIVLRKKID